MFTCTYAGIKNVQTYISWRFGGEHFSLFRGYIHRTDNTAWRFAGVTIYRILDPFLDGCRLNIIHCIIWLSTGQNINCDVITGKTDDANIFIFIGVR